MRTAPCCSVQSTALKCRSWSTILQGHGGVLFHLSPKAHSWSAAGRWKQGCLSKWQLNQTQVFCQESKAGWRDFSLGGSGSCSQSLGWLKLPGQRWAAVSAALRAELRNGTQGRGSPVGRVGHVLRSARYPSAWCNGKLVLSHRGLWGWRVVAIWWQSRKAGRRCMSRLLATLCPGAHL